MRQINLSVRTKTALAGGVLDWVFFESLEFFAWGDVIPFQVITLACGSPGRKDCTRDN